MLLFEALKADHKKVSAILGMIEKTTEKQSARRKTLFEKFQAEFISHADAEEESIYVPLKAKNRTHDLIMEAYEEHGLVEHMIEQVCKIEPDEEIWIAKMTVIKELIEHHVKEEETILFKKMKAICDTEELDQMADDYQVLKKEKMESQTKGMIDNLVSKVRDKAQQSSQYF